MGMALDEPTEEDTRYDVDGLRFIVANNQKITVLGESGMEIDFEDSVYPTNGAP